MLVNGRYEGAMDAPLPSGERLDLRIDLRTIESPRATHKVSADVYAWPDAGGNGLPPHEWRDYRESWIVDKPTVVATAEHVDITGAVRVWGRPGIHSNLRVVIPRDPRMNSSATVTVSDDVGPARMYACSRVSDAFRDVELTVAVCQGIAPPHLPSYAVDGAPPVTFTSAFADAGIHVSLAPVSEIESGEAWSNAALHDALACHHLSQRSEWPRWSLLALLAGSHRNPRNAGVVFDDAPPHRAGFAIFRNHPWFVGLPRAEPQTPREAVALRKYLFTWVHEAGHAFGLMHSWEKGRPGALSWMNEEGEYDRVHGPGRFWEAFDFRFDEEEILHLRHGDLPSVVMGGRRLGTGVHLRPTS